MKSGFHTWSILAVSLLALNCLGCREKSSGDQSSQETRSTSQSSRPLAGKSHSKNSEESSRDRGKQTSADQAKSKSRFLELWNLDGNGPMSEGTSGAIRDLLQQEIPKWNQSQLKTILDELMAGDLSDPGRVSVLDAMLRIYAEHDPADTLKMYDNLITASPSNGVNIPAQVVLGLANQDPWSAAQWLSNQKARAATLEGEVMMQKVIRKAAEQNPALAVNILNGQVKVDSRHMAHELANAALTRDQKVQLLDELRSHIGDPEADNLRALHPELLQKFGASFNGSTVDETRKWVESARLSPEELRSFTEGYKASRKPGEAEKLSDWLKQTQSTTHIESP